MSRKLVVFLSISLGAAVASTLSAQGQGGNQGNAGASYAQQMGGTGGQGGAQQRFMQLRKEFMQLRQTLQQVRQQAMQDSEVVSLMQKLTDTLKQQMIKAAPGKKDSINQFFAMQKELRGLMESGQARSMDQAKMQGKVQKFQQMQQKLADAQKQAMQTEAFKKVSETFATKLQAKMKSINPDLPKLEQRIQQVGRQLQAMQQQMRGQMQPRGGMQGGPGQ